MMQDGTPQFNTLLALPQPISTAPSTSTRILEYPTASPIDASRWAISDGTGRLYVVRMNENRRSAVIEENYELLEQEIGSDLMPFRMHSVDVLPSGEVIALLSVVGKIAGSPTTGGTASERLNNRSTTIFDFLSVQLLPASSDSSTVTPLDVTWRLRSHDLPSFVTFSPITKRYIIGSASPLFASLTESSTSAIKLGKQAASESVTVGGAPITPPQEEQIEKPPPFSWTQDKESVTVVFAIPSDTPTSSIRATFSRQFLSILVGSAASSLSPSNSKTELPRVSHKKMWDAIDPHTSVWTFDRDAEGRDSTYGLLSLHLEKANPGTRWSDVFATSPPIEDGIPSLGVADRELENIHETLDPSELASISESMEKWSQGAVGRGEEGEGGNEQPTSLMGMEIDVEVDGESGRNFVVTWIEDVLSDSPTLIRPHPTIPYALLSTPLPISDSSTRSPDESIVVKHDVDGVIFSPPSSPESYLWTHTSTFPALAFVLATKRDAYFVHHLSNRAVFAFDSPSNFTVAAAGSVGRSGAGNLFVYFNMEGERDEKGRQLVLRVGGPSSGALMGAAGIATKEGRTAVLALCEKELVVFTVI